MENQNKTFSTKIKQAFGAAVQAGDMNWRDVHAAMMFFSVCKTEKDEVNMLSMFVGDSPALNSLYVEHRAMAFVN